VRRSSQERKENPSVLCCAVWLPNHLGAIFIQVCDFGSAMFAGQNEITPYLVSRFYRPPEVVLGLEYSFPMDLWAIGCCLFELFTGKITFAGKSNNEMVERNPSPHT
jgi:serine/threonine-protein kinase PRP4